jgi:hypothetical protein
MVYSCNITSIPDNVCWSVWLTCFSSVTSDQSKGKCIGCCQPTPVVYKGEGVYQKGKYIIQKETNINNSTLTLRLDENVRGARAYLQLPAVARKQVLQCAGLHRWDLALCLRITVRKKIHVNIGLPMSAEKSSAMKHIGAEVMLFNLLPSLSGPPVVAFVLGADQPVVLGTDVPLPHLV